MTTNIRERYRAGVTGYRKFCKHGAEVFVNEEKLVAIAFKPKAQNPAFHSRFLRKADMEDRVKQFFAGLAQREKVTAERRAARSKPHTLKPGDILYTSWGYDQTNVEFFQVVRVNSPTTVTLHEIKSAVTSDGTSMSGRATACEDQFVGQPIKKQVDPTDNSVKIGNHYAWPWDGRPKSCSWYA